MLQIVSGWVIIAMDHYPCSRERPGKVKNETDLLLPIRDLKSGEFSVRCNGNRLGAFFNSTSVHIMVKGKKSMVKMTITGNV